MKKLILGGIACAMLATAPAFAAELPIKSPIYKAPEARVFNWTGFYFGVNVIAGSGRSSFDFGTFTTGSFSYGGAGAGLHAGYNYQPLGSLWVFGVEGSVDVVGLRGSTINLCGIPGCETSTNYLAMAGVRFGFTPTPMSLLYAHVDLAGGDISARRGIPQANADHRSGWAAGVGYEHSFGGGFSMALQYDHVDLGRGSCTPVAGCDIIANVDQKIDALRFKLSYAWMVVPGLFSSESSVPSDARLKTDIVAVGHLDNGLALYRFRYVDTEQYYVGVMAQEVALIRPDAVIQEGEYLLVDYGKLGLQMQTWEEWSTSRPANSLVAH